MDDLVYAGAERLAAAIRTRRVSAVEVYEAYAAQIARHNPALNAIVTFDEMGARRQAEEADAALARGEVWGPLHGVPVTVKDSLPTAGLRTTSGFSPLAGYVPARDAPVVARLRAAGAVILGKTNLPPFAGDYQTDNEIFGRSNNPWDLARTPGGSTGGGAAAVAAGLTALEIGSDVAGSLRVPAHYCGVYALKPTEHRVPLTGHIPEPPGAPRGVRHMATIGPMARSVGDLVLALTVIAGPDGHDWQVPPVPLVPERPRPLTGLRLAWSDDFAGLPVTTDTREAFAGLARRLQRLGCHVECSAPEDFDVATAWRTWDGIASAEQGSSMPAAVAAAEGPEYNATMRQFTALLMQRDALIGALEDFLRGWDAFLCPVSVGPAFKHCPPGTPIPVDGTEVPYRLAGGGWTRLFNLTGHPVVVLPLTRSREGLPIGVQLVGRRWGEMHLLMIAERLAEVLGPFRRPPGC